jgi:hypothetical protein
MSQTTDAADHEQRKELVVTALLETFPSAKNLFLLRSDNTSYRVRLTHKTDKEQQASERMFYFVILSALYILPLSSIDAI